MYKTSCRSEDVTAGQKWRKESLLVTRGCRPSGITCSFLLLHCSRAQMPSLTCVVVRAGCARLSPLPRPSEAGFTLLEPHLSLRTRLGLGLLRRCSPPVHARQNDALRRLLLLLVHPPGGSFLPRLSRKRGSVQQAIVSPFSLACDARAGPRGRRWRRRSWNTSPTGWSGRGALLLHKRAHGDKGRARESTSDSVRSASGVPTADTGNRGADRHDGILHIPAGWHVLSRGGYDPRHRAHKGEAHRTEGETKRDHGGERKGGE